MANTLVDIEALKGGGTISRTPAIGIEVDATTLRLGLAAADRAIAKWRPSALCAALEPKRAYCPDCRGGKRKPSGKKCPRCRGEGAFTVGSTKR